LRSQAVCGRLFHFSLAFIATPSRAYYTTILGRTPTRAVHRRETRFVRNSYRLDFLRMLVR
jgi:hypothetical protein